jgi:DNA polymerase elongation subunit (family B)
MINKDLLYGRDSEEQIVAIENLRGQPVVEIFTREKDKVTSRYETFEYFLYTSSDELPIDLDSTKLLGKNHYDRLLKFKSPEDYYNTRNQLEDYVSPFLSSQYQLQTGKTLFKGMTYNDPLVMFFDLEVLTKKGYNFPNAKRVEDEIFIIAIKTNRDTEIVLFTENPNKKINSSITKDGVDHIKFTSEKKMLEFFVKLVRDIDPDIIANHNIFNFDLDYLSDRANLLDVELQLGRNGSTPNSFETSIKFADRKRDYNNYQIHGRHIIDTQYLCEYADVVLRSMPSYALKEVVKFLGKASNNRTYIEGDRISNVWRNEDLDFSPEDLLLYAIDDVREAEIVYNEYGQSIFTLTQMIPMSYQDVFRYGTGNQVEYVFMREYLHGKWAYPKRDEHRSISGGYAKVLKFGLFKGSIVYADVKSLYPSLGILLGISPKKDIAGLYQKILNLLINIRYEIKAKIAVYKEEGNDVMVQQQKATDGSVKIFLNTMSYGFLAFGGSNFNDYDEAERITTTGQSIVKQMIEIIEKDGGVPIKVDTDGVALQMPKDWVGREEEYCDKRLTDALPEGIVIECDGKYNGILSFDGKSYALLDQNNKIEIKGNTLIGRSIPTFLTDFTKDCIYQLFHGQENCESILNKYKDRLNNYKLNIEDIYERKNLNMSLEEYKNKQKSGTTTTQAQYELAIKLNDSGKLPLNKGDVVKFYIKKFPYELTTHRGKPKIKKMKLRNFEAVEHHENYDYDYELSYYEKRLEKACKKFMCLGKDKFELIFNKKIYPKAADVRRYENLTDLKWEI